MQKKDSASESAKYLAEETTMEQLWGREMFTWKVRWVILFWLFVWLFLPHKSEIPLPTAAVFFALTAVYNLCISVAVTLRYKPVLSAVSFAVDSLAVTAAVYLTGGINSELWPLYFILIIHSSMIINFKSEIVLMAFIVLLYFAAAVQDAAANNFIFIFLNRAFLMSVSIFAASFIADTERRLRKRAENVAFENSSLYERVNRFNEELERKIDHETGDLKKRYQQLEILYKISNAVTQDMDLENILSSVIKGVQEGLGFDRVGIFEVDEETKMIKGRIGVDRWGKPENIDSQIFGFDEEDNNFAKIYHGKIGFFFTEDADSTLPESQKKYMVPGVGQNAVVPLKVQGRIIGMIAVDNLISKKKITEEDLHLLITFAEQAAVAINNARMFGKERETSVKLKKLEETKSAFLSKMSHEIRTPLANIKESLTLIMKNITGETTPQQQKFLGIASSNTEKLMVLIDELLDSAKMEARQLKLEISPFDIKEVVDNVLFESKSFSSAKEITVSTDIPPDIPAFHADKNRIARVLTNLMNNALKYTDKGGHVTVSVRDGEKDVIVSVADNGIGLRQEQLGKIFAKFYQVEDDTIKFRTGVGLGLSICRETVEAHGGRIWAESDGPGTGSKFIFSLPKG
ncbi:MAG: ATP-binding protein [Candidatus Saganbacteria bacterium]|nr:ATP-binding protein [Candidatus Saganbacteria bacterium]